MVVYDHLNFALYCQSHAKPRPSGIDALYKRLVVRVAIEGHLVAGFVEGKRSYVIEEEGVMANRNWSLITSGATFEALATTLIFFEDPKAALFGRRGKDGGQDARSGNGARVFQAKYHEDGSAAKAIADAKKEAAKIVKYRKPDHARYAQWSGVTHWHLVTNAPFNPTDRLTWDTEVVPLFAAQGLSADYWERANLDALLDKYPAVDRSFFQNEPRAFLSLPEIRERLPFEEPFLQRSALAAFFGRENEIAQVRDFLLSDKLFLVVHGAGGMGKTRLLVEAGEELQAETHGRFYGRMSRAWHPRERGSRRSIRSDRRCCSSMNRKMSSYFRCFRNSWVGVLVVLRSGKWQSQSAPRRSPCCGSCSPLG